MNFHEEFHGFAGCFHHRIHVQCFFKNPTTKNKENETKSFEKFLATMVYSTPICLKVCINELIRIDLSSSSSSSYLHSCEEPIIHGNLTCDTIFIQNTGLIKIGSSKCRSLSIEQRFENAMIKCLVIAVVHYPQLKVLADLGMGRSGGLFPF